jgi:hypothetical protein
VLHEKYVHIEEVRMKQNITLSIEKELIKKGKIIAARKDSSISKMMSDLLKEIVDQDDRFVAAKRNALNILKKGFHLGGRVTWKREDLHER